MSDLSRRASAVVLMAMLALIVGSGRARAEAIVVTDTVLMPTGDPQVIIDFQIALAPGTSLLNGDTIEFSSVPDVNPHLRPTYIYMGGDGTDYSNYFDVQLSTGNLAGTTDITLKYNQSSSPAFTSPADAPLSIGDLYVLTTGDYPPLPGSPLLNPIDYASTVGGVKVSGETIPTVVPEPASLALALVGAGLASPWLLRQRRRKASRS